MYWFLNHSKAHWAFHNLIAVKLLKARNATTALRSMKKGQFQETSSFYDEDDNDVYSFSSSSSLLIGLFLALRSQ